MKVMLCVFAPAWGTKVGALKEKVPFTLALPPLMLAADRACPSVMIDAIGWVIKVGVALAMVKSTVLLSLKLGLVDVTVSL